MENGTYSFGARWGTKWLAGDGIVSIKTSFCYEGAEFGAYRDSDVELSNENENIQAEPDPRTPNTTSCTEWDLIKGMAVMLPGSAESDMCEIDASPGEEVAETRERKKPVEDGFTSYGGLLATMVLDWSRGISLTGGDVDVGQTTKSKRKDQGVERTSLLVNIPKPFWHHVAFSKSCISQFCQYTPLLLVD